MGSWNKDPSALGILITLVIYSSIFIFATAYFVPVLSLACIFLWIIMFVSILGYDRRHWGSPGPETHGMYLSSQTRKITLPDYSVQGVVFGSCVKTRNLFSSARAESRSIVGGEALQFTSLVEECRNIALSRMCRQAKNMGCNGVIGYRMITTESLFGATEIIAFGTAIRIGGLDHA
jgi:uncharacterized protein YbjQ (UPF0145 family)